MWRLWMCLGIAFALHGRALMEINITTTRASNIELVPYFVLVQAPESADFVCSQHGNNDVPLEYSLSKNISSKEIEVTARQLNQTSIQIRLEIIDYIGIFHLLCYQKGEQHHGTRADVIVKGSPGVLQLHERCRVYDRQFIKCIIRAPAISRAIEHDYPARFTFDEFNYAEDQTAFKPKFEFLTNESVNGTLAFKWKPTVEGRFPSGVRMRMRVTLPHFDESVYIFDMTPSFSVTPNYTAKATASDEIKIELMPTSSSVLCEKSIQQDVEEGPMISALWTIIDANQNDVLVGNLRSNSIYRICIRCREKLTDPNDVEKCQQIRTLKRFTLPASVSLATVVVTLCVGISVAFLLVLFMLHRRRSAFKPVNAIHVRTDYRHENCYEERERSLQRPGDSTSSGGLLDNDSMQHAEFENDCPSFSEGGANYIPIANSDSVINMCDIPQILKPPDSTDQ